MHHQLLFYLSSFVNVFNVTHTAYHFGYKPSLTSFTWNHIDFKNAK